MNDNRGLRNGGRGDRRNTGSAVDVCSHILISVDVVSKGVKGGVHRTSRVEVEQLTASQSALGVLGKTLEVRDVLSIAGGAVDENTVHVDVAGAVLVPCLVHIYIRFHAGEKTVSVSAVNVSESLNIGVAVQLCDASNVVRVGDARSRTNVGADNNLKVDIGVRRNGVVQRLPGRRTGVNVEREQNGIA